MERGNLRLAPCRKADGSNGYLSGMEEASGLGTVELGRSHFHPRRQVMDSIDKGARFPPVAGRGSSYLRGTVGTGTWSALHKNG